MSRRKKEQAEKKVGLFVMVDSLHSGQISLLSDSPKFKGWLPWKVSVAWVPPKNCYVTFFF